MYWYFVYKMYVKLTLNMMLKILTILIMVYSLIIQEIQ